MLHRCCSRQPDLELASKAPDYVGVPLAAASLEDVILSKVEWEKLGASRWFTGPLGHGYGLMAIAQRGLWSGATMVVVPRFELAPYLDLVERQRAFVVLEGEATAADLTSHVAERVAPYKKVRRVDFIDATPRSASGKILRRLLSDRPTTTWLQRAGEHVRRCAAEIGRRRRTADGAGCVLPEGRQGSRMASASISTSHSASMKRGTCITVHAGRTLPNTSPCTAATAGQSSMRVRKTRVRTTSASEAPASARAAPMMSRQRRAWPAGSPGAAVPPSTAIGAVPATVTNGPTRTAREKPITGSSGLPEEMCRRD
jgi:hypothetical protein